MYKTFTIALLLMTTTIFAQTKNPVDFVNPFIGTINFGTTNPGAVCPNGLMSVVPFNVMGSKSNQYDKDNRWWSTPYFHHNKYFTGYSHVNLSGVGCPDMGSLLLMPTTGDLVVDFTKYGSQYTDEKATPGYYSNILSDYNIKTEVTATLRTGLSKFTFPKGKSHILLNLGEGLTNESGATVKKISETEIEGSKLLGTFCYTASQAVYPIYFVLKINKAPQKTGYWKKQRPMTAEAAWNSDAGKYKIYTQYDKEMSGDDIGVWFSFDFEQQESVEVKIGVSFVSIENARLNLNTEQPDWNFDRIAQQAKTLWNNDLSRILVTGGSDDDKTIFYTAFYHLLIHPNILQDVNGEYPMMESSKIGKTNGNRYTVFSLWDTYRNVHPLLCLLFPDRQADMVTTMLEMYKESGWLPKWELFGRESHTMNGDPALIVINDTWQRSVRNFDVELAYQAMLKHTLTPQNQNFIRKDYDDYLKLGYIPLRQEFDNSVSSALEYYLADWNVGQFAKMLGKKSDYEKYNQQSLQYKNYFYPKFGLFAPRMADGSWYSKFNPLQGQDFEPCPGFHEGTAWNYAFTAQHDIAGLVKLMGGQQKFVEKLQTLFDKQYFDMANEPDIHAPYLFSRFPNEAWQTQKTVKSLIKKYFTNKPDGLPGNEDTGTMSAWLMYSMMGFYPTLPGEASYTLTTPSFEKTVIRLDKNYYSENELVIKTDFPDKIYIKSVEANGKKVRNFTITHQDLVNAKEITYQTSEQRTK